MSQQFETVIVNFDEETGVGHLTLNRPDSLNALSPQLRRDIVEGLRALETHNSDTDGIGLRVVVVEGAEGNFCAGADIDEFGDDSPGRNSQRHYRDFIMEFPVPIIAKVRGYCLGGGLETAMACDFRFADADAQFGLPEVDLGILPGGGVQFVSRLVNPSYAKMLAMTGEHIPAAEAAQAGIINRYVEEGLDGMTREFAETIASKPPLAIQAIKASANVASETTLRQGRMYDRRQGALLRQTEDHEKGTRAFAEEEYDPEFKGR